MRILNRHIDGLGDGIAVSNVELDTATGIRQEFGLVYVYAPFVLFRQMDNEWNVTHAPSGYHVTTTKRKRDAVETIMKLRAVADWNFTSTKGEKATRAKKAAKGILPSLVRIG